MARKKSRYHRRSRRHRPSRRRLYERLLLACGGISAVAICCVIKYGTGSQFATAKPPVETSSAAAAQPRQQPASQQIVAHVNGQPISRHLLAQECLAHHGTGVLETVMNRHLIALECRRQNVVITEAEINAEIDRVSRRFGLPVEQWLKLLQTERDISPQHYRDEIIWPTVALRHLARQKLNVTEEESQQELEARFGPKVQTRMIAVDDPQLAARLQAEATANPDNFSRLAVKHSIDVNSASAGGLIQPIRRNMGEPAIEQAAFSLQPGGISPVIQLGNQYVILKCERHIAARWPAAAQLNQTREAIVESIRDKKLRTAGSELFRHLQQQAQVRNVLNDPALRQQMPGVAATINGHQITTAELAEACISRHGKDVLSAIINRKLIEVELQREKLTVTQQDMDAEIARAAIAAGVKLKDGRPDFEKWFEMMKKEQEISEEIYLSSIVWPSVALRKLVSDSVTVTEEDLKKAYEANFGPRVRCRAIVMQNLRRAQEVWNMYRSNPTVENFSQLAAEYSIDPGGKSLGGVVPPIQRHGGQPALENEAFKLQPGQHSGVIQIGDKYVFLLCEGITKPVAVEIAEVRDVLYEDILEKKHRLVMAKRFQKIMEAAQISNYLYPEASKTAKGGSPRPPARG